MLVVVAHGAGVVGREERREGSISGFEGAIAVEEDTSESGPEMVCFERSTGNERRMLW